MRNTSKEEDLKIGLVKPKLAETLIHIAHRPTFPFSVIQLKRITKTQSFASKVKVDPTLYEHLIKHYRTNKLVIYMTCQLARYKIDLRHADVFCILNRLSIMSKPVSSFGLDRKVSEFSEVRDIAKEVGR